MKRMFGDATRPFYNSASTIRSSPARSTAFNIAAVLVEDLSAQDHPLQLLVRHAVIRAEGLHENGNRLVNADGVDDLNPSNRNQKIARIRSLPRLTVL